MYAHNVPIRLARALAPPRFAAGVVVTLALLSAACSNDSASRIIAPSLLSSRSSDEGSSGTASRPTLGVASSFAILSAADGGLGAVTCVGPATITGNVGSSGVITPGACSIIGSQIAPVSAGVVAAFDKAYANLAGQQCTQTILTEAYTNQTLSVNSGVICFPNEVTFTNSTLTLHNNITISGQGAPNVTISATGSLPNIPGLQYLLDASNASSLVTGGEDANGQGLDVTQWNDLSGNNNNFAEALPGQDPVLVPNAFGSLPALQFYNDNLGTPLSGARSLIGEPLM